MSILCDLCVKTKELKIGKFIIHHCFPPCSPTPLPPSHVLHFVLQGPRFGARMPLLRLDEVFPPPSLHSRQDAPPTARWLVFAFSPHLPCSPAVFSPVIAASEARLESGCLCSGSCLQGPETPADSSIGRYMPSFRRAKRDRKDGGKAAGQGGRLLRFSDVGRETSNTTYFGRTVLLLTSNFSLLPKYSLQIAL